MAQERLPEVTEQEDSQKGKFLTFCMGKELYGIEIRCVTEIVGVQPVTEIPEFPPYLRGIINLRGKIYPVMDMRLRFKRPFREYDDRTCIIVVDIENAHIGLIVDSVSEVLTIPESEIVPPPETGRGNGSRYIQAVGKLAEDVVLLLDCEKLLTEDELEHLNAACMIEQEM